MQIPPDAIGFAVVIGTLLGSAFGLKLLIWGKTPIQRLREGPDEARIAELQDQIDDLTTLAADQARVLDDLQDRMDFTERLLARSEHEPPSAIAPPPSDRA